jgi:hypothetical protein
MTDRKLMQQALHTLEGWANVDDWVWPETAKEQAKRNTVDAIAALRERLAKPEQEPVAWRWKERINGDFDSWVVTSSEPPPHAIEKQPLYTAPPQRQPLTDEQIYAIRDAYAGHLKWGIKDFARAIEAAHGIRNNDAA